MAIQLRGGGALINSIDLLTRAEIKQGDSVAEFGCGTSGHLIFPAAHLVGKSGKVYAIDILKPALEAMESRAKMEGVENVETVWADLERPGALKIADASVDLVILLHIVGQVKEKEIMCREAARILKPGGTILIADWKITATPFGPPPEKRLNPTMAKQLASAAGGELKQEFDAGPYHYGLVFKRKS